MSFCLRSIRNIIPVKTIPSHMLKEDIVMRPVYPAKNSLYAKYKLETSCCKFKVSSIQLESSREPKPTLFHNSDGNKKEIGDKPSPEQVENIFNVLSKILPDLFVKPHDYSIYHPNLVFENNIRGVKTVGLHHYVTQVALLRAIGHLKFAFVKLEVLKITRDHNEGIVEVRWRIRGISALKVMFTFWKYKLWKYQEIMDNQEVWFDGFSTFYVGSDGRIYKHVVDKIIPSKDEDSATIKKRNLAGRLAVLFGLVVSRQSLADLTSVICEKKTPKPPFIPGS